MDCNHILNDSCNYYFAQNGYVYKNHCSITSCYAIWREKYYQYTNGKWCYKLIFFSNKQQTSESNTWIIPYMGKLLCAQNSDKNVKMTIHRNNIFVSSDSSQIKIKIYTLHCSNVYQVNWKLISSYVPISGTIIRPAEPPTFYTQIPTSNGEIIEMESECMMALEDIGYFKFPFVENLKIGLFTEYIQNSEGCFAKPVETLHVENFIFWLDTPILDDSKKIMGCKVAFRLDSDVRTQSVDWRQYGRIDQYVGNFTQHILIADVGFELYVGSYRLDDKDGEYFHIREITPIQGRANPIYPGRYVIPDSFSASELLYGVPLGYPSVDNNLNPKTTLEYIASVTDSGIELTGDYNIAQPLFKLKENFKYWGYKQLALNQNYSVWINRFEQDNGIIRRFRQSVLVTPATQSGFSYSLKSTELAGSDCRVWSNSLILIGKQISFYSEWAITTDQNSENEVILISDQDDYTESSTGLIEDKVVFSFHSNLGQFFPEENSVSNQVTVRAYAQLSPHGLKNVEKVEFTCFNLNNGEKIKFSAVQSQSNPTVFEGKTNVTFMEDNSYTIMALYQGRLDVKIPFFSLNWSVASDTIPSFNHN